MINRLQELAETPAEGELVADSRTAATDTAISELMSDDEEDEGILGSEITGEEIDQLF